MKDQDFYPELPEQAQKEAMELLEKFKSSMGDIAEKTIQDFYCDIMPHIESDSWTNYKSSIIDALKGYKKAEEKAPHNFKAIRKKMYEENKDLIIDHLNKDLLDKITDLKRQLNDAYESAFRV